MFSACRFRIYPNKKQQELIAQHFGCRRWVYNWVICERQKQYKDTGKTVSRRELQDRLVHEEKLKHPWLCDANSQTLLAELVHADIAFTKFLRGEAGYPQFKSRKSYWQLSTAC